MFWLHTGDECTTSTPQAPTYYSDPDTENLLTSLISPQAQEALLIIGGIEIDPGPPTTETHKSPQPLTREQRQADTLARMIVEANNTTVQDVLRLYDPAMTLENLKKSLKKSKVAPLNATMEYLSGGTISNDTKDVVIDKLLVRIQSLFPDNCSLCKQDYVVHRTDKRLLNCAKCDQGIHSRCLAKILGIAEVELENLTPEEVTKKINPLEIKSIIYLCGHCHNAYFSPEEPAKPKPRQLSRIAASACNTDSESRNTDSEAVLSEIEEVPPQDTNRSNQTNGHHSDSQDGGNDTDSETEVENHSRNHRHTKTKQNRQPRHKSSDEKRQKPTCSFYLKGQCRHGISGKGCSRAHPPLCRKLMTFGNRSRQGCTKGKECSKIHPKMCSSSLQTRECLDDKCSSYHIKGTRRVNSKPLEQKTHPTRYDRQKSHQDSNSKPHSESPSNPNEAFLEKLFTNFTADLMSCLEQKLLDRVNQLVPSAPAAANLQPNLPMPLTQAVLLPNDQLINPGQGMTPQFLRV